MAIKRRFVRALAGFALGLPAICLAQTVPAGEVPLDAARPGSNEPMARPRLQELYEQGARRAQASSSPSTLLDFDQPPAGGDKVLLDRYAKALHAALVSAGRLSDLPAAARCRLYLRQLPGGSVIMSEAREPCDYDEKGRRSLEAAVLKAQPLPYSGFEPVFQRQIVMTFQLGAH